MGRTAKKRLVIVALAALVCFEVVYNSESCKNFLTNQTAAFLLAGHDRDSLSLSLSLSLF